MQCPGDPATGASHLCGGWSQTGGAHSRAAGGLRAGVWRCPRRLVPAGPPRPVRTVPVQGHSGQLLLRRSCSQHCRLPGDIEGLRALVGCVAARGAARRWCALAAALLLALAVPAACAGGGLEARRLWWVRVVRARVPKALSGPGVAPQLVWCSAVRGWRRSLRCCGCWCGCGCCWRASGWPPLRRPGGCCSPCAWAPPKLSKRVVPAGAGSAGPLRLAPLLGLHHLRSCGPRVVAHVLGGCRTAGS